MQISFQVKDETIYLVADDNNYALARPVKRTRNGDTTTELESFKWFANIGSALNRIIDLKVKRSNAQSLLELRQVIEAAQAEIVKVWDTSAEVRQDVIK